MTGPTFEARRLALLKGLAVHPVGSPEDLQSRLESCEQLLKAITAFLDGQIAEGRLSEVDK